MHEGFIPWMISPARVILHLTEMKGFTIQTTDEMCGKFDKES